MFFVRSFPDYQEVKALQGGSVRERKYSQVYVYAALHTTTMLLNTVTLSRPLALERFREFYGPNIFLEGAYSFRRPPAHPHLRILLIYERISPLFQNHICGWVK